MTNPLTFIGVPDWRSALLAALFTLPWLLIVGRGYVRRWPLWAALAAGAVIFPISIAWVQVPIQQALSALWMRVLDVAAVQRWLLAVAVPSIAASGAVQEGAKFLVAALGLGLLKAPHTPRAGLALGAAAGAGFGGLEAFWVFNQVFASGMTWATVQLYGAAAVVAFIERFFAVPFHVAAAALAGYGLATGRPWRFLLLAAGLHSLVNYGVILMQAGILNAVTVEVWVAAVAVACVAGALWLLRSSARREREAAQEAGQVSAE